MANSLKEKGSISVQMENIFPLIKKWLYSEKDIFVRELVTNGLDAINKFKHIVLRGDVQLSEGEEYSINVKIDRDKRQITFSDNGIGMTADEVKKYINEIAFSGASDFLGKYKNEDEQSQIIGHFGLGFYSSFMIAGKVEIDSLSWQKDSESVHWSCDGSPDYEIEKGSREQRGTDVILTVFAEEEEFLDEFRIQHILETYCSFMPVPIFLNGKRVNEKEALWTMRPSDLKDEDYKDFYRYLYPFEEEPIFWIHINAEFPVRAKGILYFPKLKHELDTTKGKIKFYYNQVYVSDNLKDLIPDFLINLRGVIDCPDMPLNVSRSYLQADSSMKKLSSHITRKVSDELSELFKSDRDNYEKFWEDISPFIKIGMMEHDKFYDTMKDTLIFKTAKGKYMAFADYKETVKDGKIYYTQDPKSSYIELFETEGNEILVLDSWIDNHFIQFMEIKNPEIKFARIDSEIMSDTVDKDGESGIVDPVTNKTFSETMTEFFKNTLEVPGIEIKTEFFKSGEIPAMIVLDENQRRMQEMISVIQRKPLDMLSSHTLVLNGNNTIIKNLKKMMLAVQPPEKDMKLIAWQVYDLALLSQKAIPPLRMQTFADNSRIMLESFTEMKAK